MLGLEQMILIEIRFAINLMIAFSILQRLQQLIKEWTTLSEAKECIVLLLIQAPHCIEH